MTELERSIIKTVAYFDVFDFPLTVSELHKYLLTKEKYSLLNIIKQIENNNFLGSCQGFYFVKGRDQIIQQRKEKYLVANKKIRKSLFYIKMLSKLPFVEAIFICNTLSILNARDESDVDLAIVAREGKIWTARFFCAVLMKIFNKRPSEENQKDKICLSFYFGADSLDLERVRNDNDIHFTNWVAQFMPVYGRDEIISEFCRENGWVKEDLVNHEFTISNSRWKVKEKSLVKRILEMIFGFGVFEGLIKYVQLKKMPEELRVQGKEDNSNVLISDTILKLHKKDNREDIYKKWEEKTRKILLSG